MGDRHHCFSSPGALDAEVASSPSGSKGRSCCLSRCRVRCCREGNWTEGVRATAVLGALRLRTCELCGMSFFARVLNHLVNQYLVEALANRSA